MVRTSNPALREDTFTRDWTTYGEVSVTNTMTLEGTVHKTGFLLLVTAGVAVTTMKYLGEGSNLKMLFPAFFASLIVALIVGWTTIFKPHLSPYTAPLYAAAEGVLLGAFTWVAELRLPGVGFQAVNCTIGTLLCLLAAYRSGMIKPTENFKLGVVAATGGIFFFMLGNMVLRWLGMPIDSVMDGGPLSIGISLVIIVVAALNLVLDFDFIESGVAARAPKYMEWYAAYGLLVTLIWLYIEFVRLLIKLQRRD